MWTATIKSADKATGGAQVQVAYTSDVPDEESYVRSYTVVTRDQLNSVIRTELESVNISYSLVDDLQDELGKPYDPKVVVKPPTPEELAKQKYFQDRSVLHTMLDNIGHGIRESTDQDYLAQAALVKSEFRPEYEELL